MHTTARSRMTAHAVEARCGAVRWCGTRIGAICAARYLVCGGSGRLFIDIKDDNDILVGLPPPAPHESVAAPGSSWPDKCMLSGCAV